MSKLTHETRGKWIGILTAMGVDEKLLSGRHSPCPMCGGKDRFRFDDKGGTGSYFCAHCGSGDGFQFLMKMKGWTFAETAKEIERIIGTVKEQKQKAVTTIEDRMRVLNRVWQEAKPITSGDEADRYLRGRGILNTDYPSLRLHPGLQYRDGNDVVGIYPCLLAQIRAKDGTAVSIHRTYLKDGKKAPVESPKKIMPGKPIAGSAIRFSPSGGQIGIAEGIETALSASVIFGIPVWAAMTAGGLEAFDPPPDVESVMICGDVDDSFTGQAAAYGLAKRLQGKGIDVFVRFPKTKDFNEDLINGVRKLEVVSC